MTESAGTRNDPDRLVATLRAAGCVFAAEEAAILRESVTGPAHLDVLCRRRVAGEPLEHLVGWVQFAGRRLSVGPGVFIPRQRSELVAAVAIAAAAAVRGPVVVVEAYCGAAPLAATVQEYVPDARVHAVDIDERALAHARRNLGDRAGVWCGDGLSALPEVLRGAVTVIAAVPPYVPDDALDLLPHESADHEPHRALLGGTDGLDHVHRLIDEAHDWLAPGGHLAIELNSAQAETVVAPRYRTTVFHDDDGQTAVLRLTRPVG
ncbi:MAG: SAM-dependent methyltransferase [Gordonia sp. (in: high G+C Gram-positive bacteria)]